MKEKNKNEMIIKILDVLKYLFMFGIEVLRLIK